RSENFGLVLNGEVVRLFALNEPVTLSKQSCNVCMGFIHLGNVAHADEYWIEPSRVEHAPQGRADRNYDSVILVGSVCQNTFCLENTHDLERNAAYLNLPTDGVLPTQKRVLNARPQNRNPVCAQVVVIIDKT